MDADYLANQYELAESLQVITPSLLLDLADVDGDIQVFKSVLSSVTCLSAQELRFFYLVLWS